MCYTYEFDGRIVWVDGEYEPFSDDVVAMVNECLRLAILAEIIEAREEEEEEEDEI